MRRTKTDKNSNRKLTFFICFLIMLAGSVLLPLFLKMHTQVQYKSIYSGYEVGEIAEKSLYAKTSIDLIDHDATEAAKQQARLSIAPVFSYSSTVSYSVISKADSLRTAVIEGNKEVLENVLNPSLAQRVSEMKDLTLLSIAYDLVNHILSIGYYDEDEIVMAKEEGYNTITLSNLYGSALNNHEHNVSLSASVILTSNNVRQFIQSILSDALSGYSAVDGLLLEEMVLEVIEPNVNYDKTLTEQRRDAAEKAVDPVVISITKGQLLIEADRVVRNEQVELLQMLITQSNNFSFLEFLGNLVFDSIVIAVGLFVFGFFLGDKNLHFVEFHILLVFSFMISLVATYFFTLISSRLKLEFQDSFLPVFFLPLFMSELTGYKRIGFVSATMLSAVMATLPTASIMTFFYCLVCGSSSVFLIRFFNRRIDAIYQWFFSSVSCSGITILFMVINQSSFTMIFTVILGTLINVTIAQILISSFLPVAEKVFNLPTVFRLYELAYGQSPILTRLSQAAPGTYSHCMAVADLSEVGARAIGANPLLARVGALYHDIGKIEHPEYFVENQSGVNKHDDISPSLSVAVIKSHVKVGADKGREVGLPAEIIKIIANHHGNDIIAYFYNEALKYQAASNDDRGETVKASDYSYNAEIPDFKECGIVMLADSIEAASRTVTPNASKYAKLINSIFLGKIERGQLDNSNLTMNDIKTLADTFVKTLAARNHSRIEYPDED